MIELFRTKISRHSVINNLFVTFITVTFGEWVQGSVSDVKIMSLNNQGNVQNYFAATSAVKKFGRRNDEKN